MPLAEAIFDAERLAAVRATGLLDTPAEEAFDRLADMAGRLLDAPFAFVTIVDTRRSYWKSCIGVGIAGDNVTDRQNTVEESFCQYVVGSGEKLIVGDTGADPRTRDNPSIEAMGVQAWAGYPVLSPGGDILGTFCVVDTRTRQWTAQDERVLSTLAEAASREIALRAAMDETDALARSLQASLLPPRLPHVPGIDVVARYAPAGSGAEVVGDFYDVFEMGQETTWGPTSGDPLRGPAVSRPGIASGTPSWGIAIGDVCGKGVEAAKVTALARHTIRAVALTETRPDRVLALLNRAMLTGDLPESLFLSAQFGALTPGNLSLCSAGHPPPLLRRASGEVEEIAVSGTLLGLVEDPKLSVTDIPLGPGDALVLHTDGVTEARGADVFGTEGLIAVLASAPPGAEAIADRIESAVRAHSGPTLADDMAVLVIRPT